MSVGEVCISVIDMSILASMIIVIVLVLRLLFKRAPGWIRVLLWGIVALRLIIPTTIESPLSLVPDNYPIENFREKAAGACPGSDIQYYAFCPRRVRGGRACAARRRHCLSFLALRYILSPRSAARCSCRWGVSRASTVVCRADWC